MAMAMAMAPVRRCLVLARFAGEGEARKAEGALVACIGGSCRIDVRHHDELDQDLRALGSPARRERGTGWRVWTPVAGGIVLGALADLAFAAAVPWTFAGGFAGLLAAAVVAWRGRARQTPGLREVERSLRRGDTVLTIACEDADLPRMRAIIRGHGGSVLGVA